MFNENNGEALKASRFLNHVLVAVLLIVSVGATGLGFALVNQNKEVQRTLVPPHIDRAFTISNDGVDEAYLALMAEWWVHLKFNVTPSNVKRQFNQLITYVPSEHWSGLQDKLMREADFIIKNDVTSFFEIEKVAPSVSKMQIRVEGTLNKTVAGRKLEPEPVTYIIHTGYPHGLIELHAIAQEVPL